MNLAEMSTKDLLSLDAQIRDILLSRLWWLVPTILAGLALITLIVYDILEWGTLPYLWDRILVWFRTRFKGKK